MTRTVQHPLDPFVGTAALIDRGWTDRLIARWLGPPDKLVAHPLFPSAPPMKFYRLARVNDAESMPEFAIDRDRD